MVVMHKELGSKRVPSLHQHYPNLALTEKYQAYHIFKGRDVSGSTIIEPPEKDILTLAELGIDKKISSLSQKIAYIHTRTFLHPPYFEYLRGCFKAIFKKRLILYNFKLFCEEGGCYKYPSTLF